MLSFFTELYQDELLYSGFARYHFYSGNIDLKDTLTELFGRNSTIPSFEIGSHIEFLCNRLGKCYTPNSLIQKHTIFPFYAPFLPYSRKEELLKDIKSSDGRGIYTKIGIVAGSICKKDSISYCSACAKEEIEKLGEAYIHREHQLQGVLTCPHHKKFLKDYQIRRFEISRIEFIRLDSDLLDLSDTEVYEEKYLDTLFMISKSAYYLLTNDLTHVSKSDVLLRYKNLLYQRELATSNLRIRQTELHDRLINHYGPEILDILESSINENDEYNWLKVATRNVSRTVHPLRHILLILFLTGDMDTFFKGIRKKYNPFGQGPWPCLNKAADHYRQDIVTQLVITADSKTRQPVGNFSCECGYVYSRKGPDRSLNDRYCKGRVKCFGSVWESKLQVLLSNKSLSYREIARQLGCDTNTVQKYGSKYAEGHSPKYDDKIEQENLLKDEYKARLLDYIQNNPKISRTNIRNLYKKEYAFLYRHEREWLFEILPTKRKQNGSQGYVNWEQRDREVLLKLQKAREELMQRTKPVRISKSSLGQVSGLLPLIEKKLHKLPFSHQFVKEISESIEQFRLRRCKTISLEMKERGVPTAHWRIQRQGGLRKKDYDLLKDQLEQILHNDNE